MHVEYIQHCGTDLSVVNAARVSFAKMSKFDDEIRQILSARDDRLINFLARKAHKSPFNHTFITLHVKAPIIAARQLVKHEYMPWNEVSRRYVTDDPEFFIPEKWRMGAEDKKQGSGDYFDDETNNLLTYNYSIICENALERYRELLKLGVAPEMARMILPQSAYTEWWWSGTLFAWAKMYALRSHSTTQEESRMVASLAQDVIEPLFPVSWKALKNFPGFYDPEENALSGG